MGHRQVAGHHDGSFAPALCHDLAAFLDDDDGVLAARQDECTGLGRQGGARVDEHLVADLIVGVVGPGGVG